MCFFRTRALNLLARRSPSCLVRAWQALENDLLDKDSLGRVNAYQPSLTSTWMFQKSMSVGVNEKVDANLIVDLLANNFRSMDKASYRMC